MKFAPVIGTLAFVTYFQLIIKYEINKLGSIPTNVFSEICIYFFRAVTNIGILSGLFAAFLSALCWMAAMSRFELSSIYPILSVNFVLVPLLSVYFLGETLDHNNDFN